MMSPDPIVAEIRQIREEFASRFNYDTGAILKYLQELDATGDRKVIRRPRRQPVAIAKSKPRPIVASATKES
jgi:hypothetical protein